MTDESWKNRTMVVGGVVGALIGVGAALLYVRAEEEAMKEEYDKGPQRKSVSPAATLPIAIAVLGVLKQISGLADRD
jgi:hypothetical protein